jgi:hypothetical protein
LRNGEDVRGHHDINDDDHQDRNGTHHDMKRVHIEKGSEGLGW